LHAFGLSIKGVCAEQRAEADAGADGIQPNSNLLEV